MIAVWRAGTAKAMADITQQASESLDLINGRQGDRGAGRNMLSDLIQSHVKDLCGRPVKPQRDVLCHALKLLYAADNARRMTGTASSQPLWPSDRPPLGVGL